jgi:hypothetical protein
MAAGSPEHRLHGPPAARWRWSATLGSRARTTLLLRFINEYDLSWLPVDRGRPAAPVQLLLHLERRSTVPKCCGLGGFARTSRRLGGHRVRLPGDSRRLGIRYQPPARPSTTTASIHGRSGRRQRTSGRSAATARPIPSCRLPGCRPGTVAATRPLLLAALLTLAVGLGASTRVVPLGPRACRRQLPGGTGRSLARTRGGGDHALKRSWTLVAVLVACRPPPQSRRGHPVDCGSVAPGRLTIVPATPCSSVAMVCR